MTVTVKALRTFSRLGGRVKAGQVIQTTEEHAAYLASVGLAMRLPAPGETQDDAPPTTPPLGPSEINPEITAVGGGWYEWRGKRYRGRAAAETARKEG